MEPGEAIQAAAWRELLEETGLPVVIAEDPLSCVVLGSGKSLDELNLLRSVAVSS